MSSHPVQTIKDLRAPPANLQRHQESIGQTRRTSSVNPADSSQVPDSLFAEWSTNQDEYTDFVHRIEKEQEDIRDAREDLLGSRFRLQVQRRELLKTREKAATQAGATFDRVRRYLIAIDVAMPDDIEISISATEQLRNDLGDQEVEYDEAEKAYNMEEWEYTQKESRFIDDMCGTTPAPNDIVKNTQPMEYPDEATRFSLGRQDIENIVAEAEGDVSHELLDIEGPLRDEDELSEAPSTVAGEIHKTITGSDGKHSTSTPDLTVDSSGSLLLAEIDPTRTQLKYAGTRRSVDEWLLHALEQSRFEKAQFQIWFSEHTDIEEWWSFVEHNWYPESPDGSQQDKADSTISEEGLSDPVSSNAMRNLFDVSDTHDSAAQDLSDLPLIAEDRVMDAFDEVNFPMDIEPRDLEDWPLSPMKPRSRRSKIRSGSTTYRTGSRAGSYPDFSSSFSTIEEESPVALSVSDDIDQRSQNSDYLKEAIPQHDVKLDIPSTLARQWAEGKVSSTSRVSTESVPNTHHEDIFTSHNTTDVFSANLTSEKGTESTPFGSNDRAQMSQRDSRS